MERGVLPSCVVRWSLLAPDSTRSRTTSRCPLWAAIKRGVLPSSVLPWSLLAPDSTRNRTTSRHPFWAATYRGVAPASVVPWSLLAPDSTRNRTISRCPLWAAIKRGVSPTSVWPFSFSAPASSSRSTHLRLPLLAATSKGVFALSFASSKLGLRGWFRCHSSSVSLFCRHATMISRSCSASAGRNSSFTSCTTPRAKLWSSSSGQLSWRSRSWNRVTPICCAKHRFNAFTEASSANSSFSKTASDSPVTAESTSTHGTDIEKRGISVTRKSSWNKMSAWELGIFKTSSTYIKNPGQHVISSTSYLWCTNGAHEASYDRWIWNQKVGCLNRTTTLVTKTPKFFPCRYAFFHGCWSNFRAKQPPSAESHRKLYTFGTTRIRSKCSISSWCGNSVVVKIINLNFASESDFVCEENSGVWTQTWDRERRSICS